MTHMLRIVIAIVAIIVGNTLIPDGDVVEVFSDRTKFYELRMFGGTALIVAGSFTLARIIVGFVKSHLNARN